MKVVPQVANEVFELVGKYPNEKNRIAEIFAEHNFHVKAVNNLVQEMLPVDTLVGLVGDYIDNS